MSESLLQLADYRGARRASHRRLVRGLAARCILVLCAGLLFLVAGKSESPAIRIGYCGAITQIDDVKWAGFDYIDLRTSEVLSLIHI